MNRLWLPALLWAALWLGGSLWTACQMQADLEQAAKAALAKAEEPLKQLHARAAGRTLVLTGTAFRESDVDHAIALMRGQVLLPGLLNQGLKFTPVSQVTSEITLQSRPEGWGVLAATATAVHLRGVAASEMEANRLGIAVRSAGQLTQSFTNEVSADGEQFLESDQLENTLHSTPSLADPVLKRGLLAVARWGRPWQELDVAKPAETLRKDVLNLGLPGDAWDSDLFAEVERVREARETFEAAEKEQRRLASLAPGHVILAVRGSQILLRGELGTEQSCQLLADAVRIAGGDERIVVDELAVSSHRKPGEAPRLLASTLPALPTGLLARMVAVGTPDTGWRVLNLNTVEIENPASLTQLMLPEGLDLRLARPDLMTVLTWMDSIDGSPSEHENSRQPPYFMIAAIGPHVYLRGAVADEATRTLVENQARRLYSFSELDTNIRLDATCLPIGAALQTLTTMPPAPPEDTVGYVAFAFSGDEWRSCPANAHLLEPEGLQQSGLLPAGTSINPLMPDVIAVTPALKNHLAHFALSPPGIPLQPEHPP